MQDAHFCGLDRVVKVITNGSGYPGTILEDCSPDFMEKYHHANIIIAKGQGNFESLSDKKAPIFFLFRAKCPVVARDIAPKGCRVELGDMILKSFLYD